MIKKLRRLLPVLLFILLILPLSAFANEGGSGYNIPVLTDELGFSAVLNGDQVDMEWNVYAPEGFDYYKVIRSTTDSDPVYPDDGYIEYSSDINFTSYTDEDPKTGTSYYRVCSIASPDRYCSAVVTIEYAGDSEDSEDFEESDDSDDSADKDSNGYYEREIYDGFDFQAVLDDGKVRMTWSPYAPEGFDYYKVVRSSSNSDPVYPDDGYILASSDEDLSSYTDSDPKDGTNHYRVCSIANPHRYCSTVVTIQYNAPSDEEEDSSYKDEYAALRAEIAALRREVTQLRAAFNDIAQNRYATAINYLREKAIVQGYDDGSYRPDNQINRAEFMKIVIGEKYKDELEETMTGCFDDVGSDWYAAYVCLGKQKGIIGGYEDGTFKPGQNISFVEAAKILANVYGLDLGEEGSDWYEKYVLALQEDGYIPPSVSSLSKPLTRAEMAELIWRIKEQKKDQDKAELLSDES